MLLENDKWLKKQTKTKKTSGSKYNFNRDLDHGPQFDLLAIFTIVNSVILIMLVMFL